MPNLYDVEKVRAMHYDGTAHEKFHSHLTGGYLRDFVYGANDGIITTFAVVAGVAGASLSTKVVLIMSFANLLADGFSMAMGNYLSGKSNHDYVKAERAREAWEVENLPTEERAEIRELYSKKGFNGELLERVVDVITSDKKQWVHEMMIGEHGLVVEESTDRLWKNAAVTFGAFVTAGLVPVLPYLWGGAAQVVFPYAISATALILFIVGSLRSLITERNWWLSGLEMLGVGALAAGAAYAVGSFLSQVV